VLIALVLFAWMYFQSPSPQPQHVPVDTTTHLAVPAPRPEPPPAASAQKDTASLGRFFQARTTGNEKVLILKTDLYEAEISTRGGLVRKWELQKYRTWDHQPVQLVDFERGGDLSLLFTSVDGKLVNTSALYFDGDFTAWRSITLSGEQQYTVRLTLPAGERGRIVKTLTFTNGTYAIDARFDFENMAGVISNYEYQVVWEHGLRYAEANSHDESSFALAMAMAGGETTEIDATKPGEVVKRDITGTTDWVGGRTKYFAVMLLPEPGKSQGAYLEGVQEARPNGGSVERYQLALKMPLKGAAMESARMTVFLGPLEYDIVKSYGRGLDQMMNLGAAWIIRPIAEYVMIPLFQFLRLFIPNYGVVLIVFALIIKLALHPLSKTQMKSMKRMQALTPLMNEIREKYKDDPEKMNQQVMHLYKEYGVNPASGCLPLLLQLPILFALYAVFRSSIELRQAGFALWITDLSVPDSILKLPFTIPFFGIHEVSGVALAMGVTMFVQQKMSTTDPRQKAMIWMMPILMTLMFNSFPAGLNLYYFMFNILSIGQQIWVNRQHDEEPLRKVDPKKGGGGIIGRIAKNLPKPPKR
jgi:YidC/Oxa1 family membrane protein insertase